MKNIEIIQSITEIIKYGLPASVICITLAIQINYLNNTIILFFAREGIIVNSINTMIYNLAIMFFAAVTSAVTPIFSLLKGAKDIDNFNKCLKMLTFIILIIGFVFTFVAIFAYELFYKICGIDIIPSFAQTSILIFSIIFIPKGLNTVTKMFLTVDHKVKIVSLMTVFEMSLLPLLFAQVLFRIEPILIYMTYGLSELVIAIFSCIYCKVNIDKQNMNDKNTIRLSFSVNKDNLYETSSYVIDFLKKNSVSDKAAYKAGLAIEEMYEYIPQQGKNINNHILIFLDGGDVVFHMIHNGVNLHLDTLKKASKDNIICNNYKLIYSLADKFDFQYLMSLNNITLRFKNI